MPNTLLIFAIAAALGLVLFAAILPILLRPTPEEHRLQHVVTSFRPDLQPATGRAQFEKALLGLATNLRARLGLQLSPKSLKRLELAGYRTAAAGEVFFAASWLTPLFGAFLGSFVPVNTLFCAFLFTVVGFLLPDMVLSSKVTKRQDSIRRALPDAVDLLVICVDAGLGLDQAVLRVGDELALSSPEIHEEFQRLHAEQRAGRPRLEAWQNLTERVRVEEVKIFVSMLTQADRFGTPLAKGLSRFAEDLRIKRRQRAEEAAAKTKIKIIFPLVLFIFPSLFIVLLAPALLGMFAELSGVSK